MTSLRSHEAVGDRNQDRRRTSPRLLPQDATLGPAGTEQWQAFFPYNKGSLLSLVGHKG